MPNSPPPQLSFTSAELSELIGDLVAARVYEPTILPTGAVVDVIPQSPASVGEFATFYSLISDLIEEANSADPGTVDLSTTYWFGSVRENLFEVGSKVSNKLLASNHPTDATRLESPGRHECFSTAGWTDTTGARE